MSNLTPLELGHLRMSVGYGTHKKDRPLSPIEVGTFFRRICDAGGSLKDCASMSQLKGTSQIGRFLHILDLPNELQHIISWGSGKDAIGFSAAFELARVQSPDNQRIVAESILADNLNSKEVRQIAQLRERSGRSIQECLKEVLGMRTTIERRYVFMGSITDQDVGNKLAELTQAQRDSMLKIAIDGLGLHGATGRLGKKIFTLVGSDRFNTAMNNIGKEKLEGKFRIQIERVVRE